METSDPMANSQAVTEPSPAASAWREWLGENGPKLLLFARQQTRSMEDAQDVFQDALVKLVEKIRNGEFVGGQDSWLPYLYYIATDDPEINISRVSSRVALGGHSVPADKIVSRYHRSLDLLLDAIKVSNRAYIFDNSTNDIGRIWLAEVTDGSSLELMSDRIPAWFQRAVLDRIS